MSFPLDDDLFFGYFLVLVLEKGTDGGVVGLIDEEDEVALEDVAGMLDLFIAGEFLFDRFCCIRWRTGTFLRASVKK